MAYPREPPSPRKTPVVYSPLSGDPGFGAFEACRASLF